MKDPLKLNFGRRLDLLIDKCHEDISPFSFISLEEKETNKRVLEEEAR